MDHAFSVIKPGHKDLDFCSSASCPYRSNEACVALLSVDLDEQDASLGDVDLEYDCAHVLVWSKGHWNREALPAPCVALCNVDGQGITAIGSNDDVYKRDGGQWKVCAPGEVPNSMTDLSVARYRGVNYEACGEDVLRLTKTSSKPVVVPAPSMVDLFHTWSKEVGSVSLRVVGERLWAVGAHHLAYTDDGKTWQLFESETQRPMRLPSQSHTQEANEFLMTEGTRTFMGVLD